ncbi:MAG: tRNA pseudouridine(13) synthase TruD, partial [Planctomycetota bacterium]
MNGKPEQGTRLSWSPEYGYATSEIPGVEFEIKTEPEDFCVDEVPLFGASGIGEHTLFTLEKRGISTWDAIRRLSSRLGLPATEF